MKMGIYSIWVPVVLAIAGICVSSVAKSCPTLCNPMDCSPPGSSLHGIFQARILERVPFPLPGDLPDPGIEPVSPVSPELARRFFTTEQPGKPINPLFSSVQFSHSVMSDSLQSHELQHTRPPCPSPTPRVHSNSHPSNS